MRPEPSLIQVGGEMISFVRLATTALLLAVSACASVEETARETRPSSVAARTLPVARAVHFAVVSGRIGNDIQGQELIARATRGDPALLDGLRGFFIDAWHDGNSSLVLVCDRAGGQALVEDAGCTHAIDAERWREPSPCAFTLTQAPLCR